MSTDATIRAGAIRSRLPAAPALSAPTIGVLLLAAAPAWAGGIPPNHECPPLPDVSGVHVFEDAQRPTLSYEIDEGRAFVPDRRPVAVVAPYNGTYSPDNPFGFVSWFRDPDTAGEELVRNLDDAWDAGFRRIVFNRPGGVIQDNDIVQMSQYHYLEHGHRVAYLVDARNWVLAKRQIDPTLEVGVFVGIRHNSPCTPCLEPTGVLPDGYNCADDPLYIPGYQGHIDAGDRTSAEWTWQNNFPWIASAFNSIWFDSGSLSANFGGTMSPQETIVTLQHNPDYEGVRIGGEAVPRGDWIGNTFFPNPNVYKAPWMALHRFFLQDTRAGEVYDPATTEVGVAFMKPSVDPVYDINDVADFRDRGYVVWAWRAFSYEFIQRTHDGENGEFYDAIVAAGALGDFNGDEAIDYMDVMDFMVRFSATDRPEHPAVWDGDVYNDDVVDYLDVIEFIRAFSGESLTPDPDDGPDDDDDPDKGKP